MGVRINSDGITIDGQGYITMDERSSSPSAETDKAKLYYFYNRLQLELSDPDGSHVIAREGVSEYQVFSYNSWWSLVSGSTFSFLARRSNDNRWLDFIGTVRKVATSTNTIATLPAALWPDNDVEAATWCQDPSGNLHPAMITVDPSGHVVWAYRYGLGVPATTDLCPWLSLNGLRFPLRYV